MLFGWKSNRKRTVLRNLCRLLIRIHGYDVGDGIACHELFCLNLSESSSIISRFTCKTILLIIAVPIEDANPVVFIPTEK